MNSFSRLLFTILFIICVGGASLWIIGGGTSRYSTSVEIEATPDTVFDWLVDGDKIQQWSTGVSEVASFTDPDKSIGDRDTTTKRTATINGETIESNDRIMRFERATTFSVQSSNDKFVRTTIFQLDPTANDTTELSYRMQVRRIGMGRFLAAFDKSNVDDRMITEIKKLKQLAEAAAPHTDPPKVDSEFESLFGP